MKTWVNAFKQFIVSLWNDWILCVSLFVPVITGLVIYFAVPYLEEFLCSHFNCESIIKPYYPLIELMLMCMPAIMFVFISVMVVLDELDNGTARYLCVTPLGKKGYIMTRYFVFSALSVVYAFILNYVFPLSSFPVVKCIVFCILFSINSYIMGLFITVRSRNKVEGMALVKLVSIVFLIALCVPYFVTSKVQYILSVFPPFWIGKSASDFSLLNVIIALITAIVWYKVLIKKFMNKIV